MKSVFYNIRDHSRMLSDALVYPFILIGCWEGAGVEIACCGKVRMGC